MVGPLEVPEKFRVVVVGIWILVSISLLSEVERRPVRDQEMSREVPREREIGEGERGEGERRKERREIATNDHFIGS